MKLTIQMPSSTSLEEVHFWRPGKPHEMEAVAAHGSGHDLRLTGSGRAEPEIKPRPAWGAVAYSDAGAVRSNDFHDDRQPKPGALASRTLAAPETVEDARAVVLRYTRPTIQDAQCTSLPTSTITSVPGRVCASAFS